MALSAKEKMRRMRAKRDSDPVRREQYLKKERERSQQRYKGIAELSKKNKEVRRSNWKRHQKPTEINKKVK
jgi:hypothetical protein